MVKKWIWCYINRWFYIRYTYTLTYSLSNVCMRCILVCVCVVYMSVNTCVRVCLYTFFISTCARTHYSASGCVPSCINSYRRNPSFNFNKFSRLVSLTVDITQHLSISWREIFSFLSCVRVGRRKKKTPLARRLFPGSFNWAAPHGKHPEHEWLMVRSP